MCAKRAAVSSFRQTKMFKTVLAHLTGSACDESVLRASSALVSDRAGHINCLRLLPDPAELIAESAQVEGGGWTILSDTIAAIEHEATERTRKAQATFAAFTRENDIPKLDDPPGGERISISWHEAAGDEFDQIVRAGRYQDVIVVAGGRDRDGRMAAEALGGIVLHSGRPVLLAPEKASASPYRKILVAWKETAEAARALTAATPLLERAESVELVHAREPGNRPDESAESSEGIRSYMRWHGLNTEFSVITSPARTSMDAILQRAKEAGADLLLMGGYGHSRIRELVFGGFTQRVLDGVELPVLMFH